MARVLILGALDAERPASHGGSFCHLAPAGGVDATPHKVRSCGISGNLHFVYDAWPLLGHTRDGAAETNHTPFARAE
jgi:hypothetical protein